MTFFSKKELQRRKIEVDRNSISSESPDVQQRLERIHANYRELDLILADIELRIRSDERLSAIDQSIVELDVFVDGKKKKWRPRHTTPKKRSKSVSPNKPR